MSNQLLIPPGDVLHEPFVRVAVAGHEWVRVNDYTWVCIQPGAMYAYVAMYSDNKYRHRKQWQLTRRDWVKRYSKVTPGLLKLRIRKIKRYATLLEAQESIALLEDHQQKHD